MAVISDDDKAIIDIDGRLECDDGSDGGSDDDSDDEKEGTTDEVGYDIGVNYCGLCGATWVGDDDEACDCESWGSDTTIVHSTLQKRSPQKKTIYSCHSNIQDSIFACWNAWEARCASGSASGSLSFATSSAFVASSIDRLMVPMLAKREFGPTATFIFFFARSSSSCT